MLAQLEDVIRLTTSYGLAVVIASVVVSGMVWALHKFLRNGGVVDHVANAHITFLRNLANEFKEQTDTLAEFKKHLAEEAKVLKKLADDSLDNKDSLGRLNRAMYRAVDMLERGAKKLNIDMPEEHIHAIRTALDETNGK